jgi:glycosyltransferase involved in cell wall biosynthesis
LTKLAVIILTFEEERHIARAISSVSSIASEIFVVDSFSGDGTVEIARSLGATVLQNRFINHAQQFQWALENAAVTADWIMRLDADEVIEPELVNEIRDKLPRLGPDVGGINLKRKHIFMGRWIRHGGRYPLILTRIWRNGHGRIESRWMDEHMLVTAGRLVQFDHPFSDRNLCDIGFFTDKHNRYATREAVDVLGRRYGLFGHERVFDPTPLSRQAAFRRLVKQHIYYRLPFPIASLAYFLFRYVLQLGFLDGREGLIYHGLQAFWYRFLVGAKIEEFDRVLAPLAGADERREALAQLTGLCLSVASAPTDVFVRNPEESAVPPAAIPAVAAG